MYIALTFRFNVIVFGLFLCLALQAQTMVYLEHSETLSFDQERIADAQILRGDVIFRHEDALMYCDSAYFYEKENSLDAFGHVRFVQGDTLLGYGDKLFYNGNSKLARLRRHVRLVHGKDNPTILTTDSLNYDRMRDIAYYYTGGTISDTLNTLTSVWGQYTPNNKQAVFSHRVHLENPKFDLATDTLLYNTDTHIADLVSPTTIVYEKETNIYSSRGWYNTETEQSMLLDRSRVVHIDGKSMTGDTIFYNKHLGYGKMIGSMEMKDTVQMVTLYGNYGEMFHDGEYGYVTDSALMVDWSDSAAYGYMHADTLYSETVPFQIQRLVPRDSVLIDSVLTAVEPDTLWQDTTYRAMRAFHNVRIYREDMQAVCDSMSYNGRDSVMTLYTEPVCWSDNHQISADTIYIYMRNGTIDYARGIGSALTIQQETDTYFDQMAGKEMIAYIRDGELRQVDVNGNALTVFFPKEDDGSFLGVNTTQSSFVKVYIENQKIHHILFTAQTTGTLYPLEQVPDGKDRLNGFFWAEQERPQQPADVFLRPLRTPRLTSGAVSAVAAEPETASATDIPQEKPATRSSRKLKTTK